MESLLSLPEIAGLAGSIILAIGALIKWAVAVINKKIVGLETQTRKAADASHNAYREITNDHPHNIREDIDRQFATISDATMRLERKLDQVNQVVNASSDEIDALQSDIKRIDHSLGEFNSLLVQEQRDRADIRADARDAHERMWDKISRLEEKCQNY